MKSMELKLKQIKQDNDKLEIEINALLNGTITITEGVIKALKTKSVVVNTITLGEARRLLAAGFTITISK